MTKTNKSSGFSLIELIVSLAIFSSLMATLMFGYSQGLGLWERGKDGADYWQSLEFRHALLDRIFKQAIIAHYSEFKDKYVPYFEATDQELSLITRASALDFEGRSRPVRLTLEEQADGDLALIYQQAGRFNDPARGIVWDDKSKVTLFEGLKSGYFRYEAPIFTKPDIRSDDSLTDEEKQRYRYSPEWLSWYDSRLLWKMPQRIEFTFKDDIGPAQKWTFSLPTIPDAWPLDVYRSE